jgi:USP6 N-terminal-like protein
MFHIKCLLNLISKQHMKNDIRLNYTCTDENSHCICTDEYGFVTEVFQNKPEMFTGIKKEWYNLIDKFEFDITMFKKEAIKRELLEKGIPLALKHRIWKKLLHSKTGLDYESLKNKECKYEYQIHVDVQRTFRYHFLFYTKYGRGQTELFHVLVALANQNPHIGYCQGMSDICAIFLMYFCETEAFEMFTCLLKRNKLDSLFDSNLSKLPSIIKIQNTIFVLTIPKIHKHLNEEYVDFLVCGVGWYMTLFARFEIKLVLRIWDFLLFYGFNVLIYFAAALLKYFENEILECKGENLFEFVSKIVESKINEGKVVAIAVSFMKSLNYRDLDINS